MDITHLEAVAKYATEGQFTIIKSGEEYFCCLGVLKTHHVDRKDFYLLGTAGDLDTAIQQTVNYKITSTEVELTPKRSDSQTVLSGV